MHDEVGEVRLKGLALGCRLAHHHRHAQHEVAGERAVVRLRDAGHILAFGIGEGEHVGGVVLAAIVAVQAAPLVLADEADRDLGILLQRGLGPAPDVVLLGRVRLVVTLHRLLHRELEHWRMGGLRQIERLEKGHVVMHVHAQGQQVAGAGLQRQHRHRGLVVGIGLDLEVAPGALGKGEQQLAAIAEVDLETLGLEPGRLAVGIDGDDLRQLRGRGGSGRLFIPHLRHPVGPCPSLPCPSRPYPAGAGRGPRPWRAPRARPRGRKLRRCARQADDAPRLPC